MKLPLSTKPLLLIAGVIVLLLALAPSFYFYNKYQAAKKIIQDPAKMTEAENKALIAKVGNIIELPDGETPEIRTVTDKNSVVGQNFFAKTENGDKVLIYSAAKKAFLYRPSLNKIINVAPVNVINPSPTPYVSNTGNLTNLAPTPTTPSNPVESIKFFLLNGTSKVGLTKNYGTALKKSLPTATVVDVDNAKKNDYPKSILILIDKSKANLTDQISKTLNIQTGTLPDGETKPENVDFLIILGSDRENI